jgi:F-type H+-transporting ATPase subunit b
MFDESFFVALSFATVIGAFLYLRLPRRVLQSLDDKAAAIESELDEARKLREQAAQVLSDYQTQAQQAEKQAEEIVTLARESAERTAAEAKVAMEAQMQRRAAQAELKIARSEEKLMKEVRTAIASLAIDAAAQLVADGLSAEKAKQLVDDSIDGLSDRLQ